MTEREALDLLARIELEHGSDPEAAHSQADDVLVQYLRDNGHKDVADGYVMLRDEVGFWYA